MLGPRSPTDGTPHHPRVHLARNALQTQTTTASAHPTPKQPLHPTPLPPSNHCTRPPSPQQPPQAATAAIHAAMAAARTPAELQAVAAIQATVAAGERPADQQAVAALQVWGRGLCAGAGGTYGMHAGAGGEAHALLLPKCGCPYNLGPPPRCLCCSEAASAPAPVLLCSA